MGEINRHRHFVFVPLAMNQTLFYEKVAKNLVGKGHKVSFICFHERSHNYLSNKGYISFNPYRSYIGALSCELSDFKKLVDKFSMPPFNHLFTHEHVAYGIQSQKEVINKYVSALRNLEVIFEQLHGDNITVIQELGGFASVISTFYVSRWKGFDHYFIEPSFFRGRFFLIKNSFGPINISEMSSEVDDEVAKIIQNVRDVGEIVIPFKDRSHYLNLRKKVFNIYNLKRLMQKLLDKYVLGYQEEFRYIFRFSLRHLKAFVNKWCLSSVYKGEGALNDRFIYFPLHVPLDVAITFRSPVFKDQLNLLDLLCRSCPLGYKIVFKEHPAMVGVVSSKPLLRLLARYDQLVLLKPEINNYKVLRKADAIVTVNSKSGAEAVTLGKPVIVLGDAFYSKSPLVEELRDLSKLSFAMDAAVKRSPLAETDILKYFTSVWNESLPGDLYQLDDVTIEHFSCAFVKL